MSTGIVGGPRVEVLFTPADFETLRLRDLSEATCAVFDVLRATTTLMTALDAGAESVRPVSTIEEALRERALDPDVLLAGERDGVRITAERSGGVAFDLGNSPREFTASRVSGRRIVATTTNGTRALRACAGAAHVLPACLRNVGMVAEWMVAHPTSHWIVVCSGTYEDAAYEDVVGAGALVDRLSRQVAGLQLVDSAVMARAIYREASGNLVRALSTHARNGRRLANQPELAPDVVICATEDDLPRMARMDGRGVIRLMSPGG